MDFASLNLVKLGCGFWLQSIFPTFPAASKMMLVSKVVKSDLLR